MPWKAWKKRLCNKYRWTCNKDLKSLNLFILKVDPNMERKPNVLPKFLSKSAKIWKQKLSHVIINYGMIKKIGNQQCKNIFLKLKLWNKLKTLELFLLILTVPAL